jgi:polyferredoxin
MSTIMVSIGRIAPIEQIRFLIVFGLPINLPQFISTSAPDWLIHFGYRMYSVMFTSTTIGLILGFIYSPRAWCAFCPIRSLTTQKKKAEKKI